MASSCVRKHGDIFTKSCKSKPLKAWRSILLSFSSRCWRIISSTLHGVEGTLVSPWWTKQHTGFYHVTTLKLTEASGILQWSRGFPAAGKETCDKKDPHPVDSSVPFLLWRQAFYFAVGQGNTCLTDWFNIRRYLRRWLWARHFE